MNLRRILLTENQSNQIVNPLNILFNVDTSWSAAICESVDYAGVSELFSYLLVHLSLIHI